ncbi:MAG: YbjN domain-containing protein [Anaerolineae bacterium]
MAQSLIDELEEYMKQYGWTFERVGPDTLISGFLDDSGAVYPLVVSLHSDLVSLQVTFGLSDDSFGHDVETLRTMLRLNCIWPLAKIGIDDAGGVVVAEDLPQEGLNYQSFALSLDILAETAQMFSAEFSSIIVGEATA